MNRPKVLIIRPGALGDTLMVLPALKALQERARVCFAGRGPALDLVRRVVEQVLDMEAAGWHALFAENPAGATLPVETADVAVLFAADPEGRFARNLAHLLPQASVWVYPSLPEPGHAVHAALHIARCLMKAGLPLDPDQAMHQARAHPLLSPPEPGSRRHGIALHPGSGGKHKIYPPEFWRSLLEILRGHPRLGREPMSILLGPAEVSQAGMFQSMAREMRLRLQVCPAMPELERLLWASRLYIGHDSGVTHLAAMAGAPTVALFRQTSPAGWAPLGPWVKVLQRTLPHPRWAAEVAETAARLAAVASGLSCPSRSAIISPA